jgi:hypothetical protein
MKKLNLRPTTAAILLFAALCIGGVFLPWGHLAADRLMLNAIEISHQLVRGDDDFVTVYVAMRPGEIDAMRRHPLDGVSGFDLVFPPKDEETAKVINAWGETLTGVKTWTWQIVFFAIGPVLALLALGTLLAKKPNFFWMGGLAVGLVIYYGAARWRLNELYTTRLLYGLDLGIGLWLTLYCAALLAAVLLFRMALPSKSKW